jgi:rubrerythrin
MSLNLSRWRRFLGLAPTGYLRVLEILRNRYIEERRREIMFTQHAHKMQYPQFRDELLSIAAEEAKHAGWLAEKIKLLGGKLPDVPKVAQAEENSWRYLLNDLEEERRCSADLLEQLRTVEPDLPEVAEVLRRIYEDGAKHRDALRAMLMRSDPQALWPA